MPFEIVHRNNGAGVPTYWYVQREEGSVDKPNLSLEAPSLVEAIAFRNILNSVHQDLMERAIKEAIPEADARLRSAAK